MDTTPSQGVEITHNAQSWLRILIASYFIAVALRLIPGTDFAILLGLVADPSTATLLGSILAFSLAYMVMIGCCLRLSAMLLGLLTVFSSFVAHVGPVSSGELGAFWRDLALVAALMLTYADQRKSTAKPAEAEKPVRRPANVADLAQHRARLQNVRPMDLRAPLGSDEIENIFLDYAEAR